MLIRRRGVDLQSTTTDDAGRFVFQGMPDGEYEVRASRTGFVALSYGQANYFDARRPITIRGRSVVSGIDLELPVSTILSGVVLDEMGQAVPNVIVSCHRRVVVDGLARHRLVRETQETIVTDGAGRYVIPNLPPGDYVILAILGGAFIEDVGRRESRYGYLGTYYPGVADVTRAKPVRSTIAGAVPAFRLVRMRTTSLSGTVTSGSEDVGGGSVRIVDSRREGSVVGVGQIRPNGEFRFDAVLGPGSYLMVATSSRRKSRQPVYGSIDFILPAAAQKPFRIDLKPEGSLAGRVVAPGVDMAGTQVLLRPASRVQSWMGTATAQIRPDGSFRAPVKAPGRWIIDLVGPAAPVVDRVELESVEVSESGLDLRLDHDTVGIKITASNGQALAGSVDATAKCPRASCIVVLFSQDTAKWRTALGPRSYVTRTGPDGKFVFTNIPKGDYFAAATDYLDMDRHADPDVLSAFAVGGERIGRADMSRPFTLFVTPNSIENVPVK